MLNKELTKTAPADLRPKGAQCAASPEASPVASYLAQWQSSRGMADACALSLAPQDGYESGADDSEETESDARDLNMDTDTDAARPDTPASDATSSFSYRSSDGDEDSVPGDADADADADADIVGDADADAGAGADANADADGDVGLPLDSMDSGYDESLASEDDTEELYVAFLGDDLRSSADDLSADDLSSFWEAPTEMSPAGRQSLELCRQSLDLWMPPPSAVDSASIKSTLLCAPDAGEICPGALDGHEAHDLHEWDHATEWSSDGASAAGGASKTPPSPSSAEEKPPPLSDAAGRAPPPASTPPPRQPAERPPRTPSSGRRPPAPPAARPLPRETFAEALFLSSDAMADAPSASPMQRRVAAARRAREKALRIEANLRRLSEEKRLREDSFAAYVALEKRRRSLQAHPLVRSLPRLDAAAEPFAPDDDSRSSSAGSARLSARRLWGAKAAAGGCRASPLGSECSDAATVVQHAVGGDGPGRELRQRSLRALQSVGAAMLRGCGGRKAEGRDRRALREQLARARRSSVEDALCESDASLDFGDAEAEAEEAEGGGILGGEASEGSGAAGSLGGDSEAKEEPESGFRRAEDSDAQLRRLSQLLWTGRSAARRRRGQRTGTWPRRQRKEGAEAEGTGQRAQRKEWVARKKAARSLRRNFRERAQPFDPKGAPDAPPIRRLRSPLTRLFPSAAAAPATAAWDGVEEGA